MSDTPTTLQDRPQGSQLSNKALQEVIRPHVPELIRKALDIAYHCKNENVQLGAIKLLLGKVLADIKAQEITGADGETLRVIAILGGTTNALPSNNSDQTTPEIK